jgi:hypothetical protein
VSWRRRRPRPRARPPPLRARPPRPRRRHRRCCRRRRRRCRRCRAPLGRLSATPCPGPSHPNPRPPHPPSDPTAAACAAFKLPHEVMVADAASLCKAMHFMAACSVRKACAGVLAPNAFLGPATAAISKADSEICRPGQIVATVCKRDTGMSRMAGGLRGPGGAAARRRAGCAAVAAGRHRERAAAGATGSAPRRAPITFAPRHPSRPPPPPTAPHPHPHPQAAATTSPCAPPAPRWRSARTAPASPSCRPPRT